jgi:hypothetical protein
MKCFGFVSKLTLVFCLAGSMQLKSATDWEVIGIDEKEPIGGRQSASPIDGNGI